MTVATLSAEVAARPAKGLALSIKECISETGIGVNGLYGAIRTGALKARKLGRKTIILRADLNEYLNSLPVLDLANNPSTPAVRNRSPIGRRKQLGVSA